MDQKNSGFADNHTKGINLDASISNQVAWVPFQVRRSKGARPATQGMFE
jgi:hypothetical protein